MTGADPDAPIPRRPDELRPAPYLGIFRRFKIKGDDAWVVGIHWAASLVAVLFIVFLVFGFYFTLPSAVSAEKAGVSRFSEQRAQLHLDQILSTIGTHPYGSTSNRRGMTDYIMQTLQRIANENPGRISFEIRDHHGQVMPNFFSKDHMYVWESMGNIIVNVHAAKPNTAALLVSAHMDTVTMSKGASDNTAAVCSLLEIIEILAHDAPAKHEVMFAFVNGEEIALLGSADLTYHDSKFRRVSLFLNVDGTPGAKQLVLRTTGGAIDTLYGAVPRPLSFVVAGDVFGTGIVDSDTDFSVYSEKLPGADLVTFSHRQIYHTLKDIKPPEGLLQFQGDNMLALIRRIAEHTVDSLSSLEYDYTPHVYFSFLNRGYAVYTLTTNYVIYVMLIIGYVVIYGVILLHRYLWWKDLGMGRASNPFLCVIMGGACVFGTFIASFGVTCLFGLISSLFSSMFSYSSAAIIFFTFMPITMTFIYSSQWVLRIAERSWGTPLEVNRHRWLWGTGFLYWIILIVTSGASKTTGSTYLIWFLALFHLIAVVIHHVFFFFGVLSEKVDHDPYEVMERHEIKEDEEDEAHYDETGEVLRRPVRPVPHERWRAAFSFPDVAWLIVGCMATLPPMLLYLDVMVPFIQMAATDMPSWIVAPLVGLLIFLLNLNFVPLTRRGHHYGVIASALAILSVILFIFLMAGGSSTFNSRAPYQVVPSQMGNTITFVPEHSYSYSLKSVAKILAPDASWVCDNSPRHCKASGFAPPPTPTFLPIPPPHGFQFAARISTPNAWVHRIWFPTGTSEVILNGIYTQLDPTNATVNFLLSSLDATTQWTIEYNGPHQLVFVDSWWDNLQDAPAISQLIEKMPSWVTFKGRGSWLAGQRYSVICA